MSKDELVERLHRIYAAVSETVEGDLAKFPPKVISDEKGFSMYQDFLGGLSDSQISNYVYGLVHNIANLPDHLKRWARKNGHDSDCVDQVFYKSEDFKLIKDLSNNDKHGYPPRDGGYSGISPQLVDVSRIFRAKTQARPGSFVGITLTSSGPKQIGDGASLVIITGNIVDGNGVVVGDCQNVCLNAIAIGEQEMKMWGVIV